MTLYLRHTKFNKKMYKYAKTYRLFMPPPPPPLFTPPRGGNEELKLSLPNPVLFPPRPPLFAIKKVMNGNYWKRILWF